MKRRRLSVIVLILFTACVFLSGCAVARAPLQLAGAAVGTATGLAKTAFAFLRKMPTPPPGVFF